jgi:hypothetical protein
MHSASEFRSFLDGNGKRAIDLNQIFPCSDVACETKTAAANRERASNAPVRRLKLDGINQGSFPAIPE